MPTLPAPPAPPARTSRSATPRGLCAPALRQWGWDCRPEQAVPIPAPRKALCCFLLHQQRVPSLLVGGQPGGAPPPICWPGGSKPAGTACPSVCRKSLTRELWTAAKWSKGTVCPVQRQGWLAARHPSAQVQRGEGTCSRAHSPQKAKSGFFGHPEPPWERKPRVGKGRGDRSCSLTAPRSGIL